MLPRIQAMFRKTYGPYGGVGVIDKPVGSPGHGSTTTYYEISKFWTKGFTNKCICMTCRCCCLNANLMFGSTLSTAYWIATKKKHSKVSPSTAGAEGLSLGCQTQTKSAWLSAAKWPFCHRWWGNHKQGSAGEGYINPWGIHGGFMRRINGKTLIK